ncbi:tyrosine-protein phosphatase [Streptomyces sp. NPDC058045]|uniref:tyrosine-protein phosphatase n=1 Tax=Streptomyces sp. NPDC058045 TaxID=3346311 RepID=UPI0036E7D8C7
MKPSAPRGKRRLIATAAAVVGLLVPAGPALAAPGATAPAASSTADNPRHITVEGVLNFRDAGGYATDQGRMKRGVLYRSGALQKTTDAGLRTLTKLGLSKVVDFRSAHELAGAPDRLPSGVEAVSRPVEASDQLSSFADILALTPAEQEKLLGDGGAEGIMLDSGRKFVTDPERRAQFGKALRDIAGSGKGATLVHCSGGRDRTAWLVAIVQTALGVSRSDVVADYLQSNTELVGWRASVLKQLTDAGMEKPELVTPLLDVREAYLQASFDQAVASYGSFRAFVHEGLGIDDATLAKLRSRLV